MRNRGLAQAMAASAVPVLLLATATISQAAAPAAGPVTLAKPAMFTASVSRVRNIEGDTFAFERDDRKVLKVRLFDANCEGLGTTARDQAKAVATNLLQASPVWILPVGQATGAAGDELWAHVWTPKGWLSESLIKGGCALRRADLAGVTLAPADAAATTSTGTPPDPPAFACTGATVLDGDTFEIDSGGRKIRARLFDVTCQDLDAAQRDAAKAAAARLLGPEAVWVFPASTRVPGPKEEMRVRIWTKEGWLSEILVKEGKAKRYDDPIKASVAAAAPPVKKPDAEAQPADTKPADKKPGGKGPKEIKWREVPISKAAGVAGDIFSCKSNSFKVTSPVWRISWDCKPVRINGPVSLTLCRLDEKWQGITMSSTHVDSFVGASGQRIVRSQPGDYWIQLVGSTDLNIKVEVAETE